MACRLFPVAVLAAIMTVWVGPAAAQSDKGMKPEAQTHLRRGSRYFRVQQFDKAIDEFTAGYLADPRPNFLYAIAQAQRLEGDCKKAIISYRQYLAAEQQQEVAGGPMPAGEQKIVKNAQEWIEQCQQQVEAAEQAAAPASKATPASVAIPASTPVLRPSPAPPPAPIPAPASTPAVPAVQVRRAPAAEPPAWWKDRIGLGLLGAGTLVALSGGVALLASSALADQGSMTLSQFNSQYQRYWTDSEIGMTCLVGGGAMALAGAGRLLWIYAQGRETVMPSRASREDEHAARITVTPFGASLEGAF